MAISITDVIDRNLDESTTQTEGNEETRQSLREIRGLYGDEILWCIFLVCYHEDEARRRLELNSLPEELRRRLEKMAEAKAGVYALKEKLEVLFELFLYVCLILETSTSKQTRRSKEDKCIVHIMLLRSGVESNPGPRTWIECMPESIKATDDDLYYLSGCIGYGWRYFGKKLMIGPAILDHIENDNKGMQNQIHHMLRKSTTPPLKACLRGILLILDDTSTEFTMTVDWKAIALRFANNGHEQQMIQRDVVARLVDVENKVVTLQAKQADYETLKHEVTSLKAENKELKTEISSLKRGAQKRKAEEGETSTDVKRVKDQ